MNFNLLALETSTEACSAALIRGNECSYEYELTQRAHTQLILPMIATLLARTGLSMSEVTHLAVGKGPGSFTGVRIGVGVAQGLAFALERPVYGISTLAALAYQAYRWLSLDEEFTIIPLLDARMQEVYGAVYHVSQGAWSTVESERVCEPQAIFSNLRELCGPLVGIGSGWEPHLSLFQALLPHKEVAVIHPDEVSAIQCEKDKIYLLTHCYPHAKDVALLAQQQWKQGLAGVLAPDLHPLYLRDNVAQKPAQIKM